MTMYHQKCELHLKGIRNLELYLASAPQALCIVDRNFAPPPPHSQVANTLIYMVRFVELHGKEWGLK